MSNNFNLSVMAPVIDSVNTLLMSESIGNKGDGAFGAVAANRSIMAYVKGNFQYHIEAIVDAATTGFINRLLGNKGDTAKTAIDNVSSMMSYQKGCVTRLDQTVSTVRGARGTTKRGSWTGDTVGYETVLNIAAGKGKLLYAYFKILTTNATQTFMRITIDGTAYELPFAGILFNTEYALAYQDRTVVNLFCHDVNLMADVRMLNYEFKTSLLIELRRASGGAFDDVEMTLFYIED